MSLFFAISCIVSYVYVLFAGRPYFFCHSAALDGVPVTMPASRQLRVLSRAGAIWLADRLPRPHNATPSFLPGACAITELASSGAAASAAVLAMNSRREFDVMSESFADGYLPSDCCSCRERGNLTE